MSNSTTLNDKRMDVKTKVPKTKSPSKGSKQKSMNKRKAKAKKPQGKQKQNSPIKANKAEPTKIEGAKDNGAAKAPLQEESKTLLSTNSTVNQTRAMEPDNVINFEGLNVDEKICADDKYFASRLELIPAKFYFPKEDDDETGNDDWKLRKFHKNKTNNAPKQQVKESSKKAKRKRYSIGIDRESNAAIMEKKDKLEKEKDYKQEAENKDTQGQARINVNDWDSDDEGGPTKKKKSQSKSLAEITSSKREPAKNLDELSERLKQKLDALRKKRGGKSLNKLERVEKDVMKKQNSKKLKRQKKKLLLKQKRADEKAKKQEAVQSLKGPESSDGSDATRSHDKIHTKLSESIAKISYGRLKVNGVGTVTNALDGESVSKEKDPKQKINGKPGKRNILNVRKMLEKAEMNRSKIEQLKKSKNPEERERAAAETWQNMEKMAKGEVDKSKDPKLLKKQLKRLEREKRKKASAWNSRLEAVKTENDEKYNKKMANIKKAAQEKVEKKLKKKGIVLEKPAERKEDEGEDKPKEKRKRKWAKMQQERQDKQNRARPGFEGKHVGLLNAKQASKKKKR